MGNTHGAVCLYGLMTSEKAQSVLGSAASEALLPDQFAAASLAKRSSFTAPIAHTAENDWLYVEIWSIFTAFNRSYQLSINAVEEPLQIIRYPVGGCIDWHVDGQSEVASNTRKLSLSIQLSPEASYGGGNIEFLAQPADPFARALGSAICFPSYCAHRVTPVTHGERLSLVAFAIGSAFR